MIVRVGDRQTGKTTRLISWLLEGHAIESYPGWSRAIVCANRTQVLSTTQLVRRATENWEEAFDQRALTDLRKAVWSMDDLWSVMRGMKLEGFEYAIDNLEMILGKHFPGTPAIITLTGS